MAYGDWGAFVYRNGERMRNYEDATPYRETEFDSGYIQVFQTDSGRNPFHAVLGEKDIRLTGYKSSAGLMFKGEKISIEPYKKEDGVYSGEIEGYKFEASEYDGNMLDLKLIEPDGTQWISKCGYEYGAGHMD